MIVTGGGGGDDSDPRRRGRWQYVEEEVSGRVLTCGGYLGTNKKHDVTDIK